MFKKLALVLFLGLPVSLASAQRAPPTTATLEIVCVTGLELFETLKEYVEIPFIQGLAIRGSTLNPVVLYVNSLTRSWSLVEHTPNSLYCILAVGESFGAVPEKDRTELQKNYDRKTL